MAEQAGWWVYVVRCRDGTFYTGIARDLAGRLREHNGAGRRAARYTRGRRPVTLHAACPVADRPAATRLERRVKALPRAAKEALPAAPGWLTADGLAPAAAGQGVPDEEADEAGRARSAASASSGSGNRGGSGTSQR